MMAKAMQADASQPAVRRQAARANAEKETRDLIAATTDPLSLAELNRWLARILMESKRYEEAVEAYKKVIEFNPNDVPAINNLAYLLMDNLDKPKEALRYSEKAAALSPADANVLDTYGWNYALIGENAKALGPLGNALSIEPNADIVLYHRARAYQKLSEAAASDGDKRDYLEKARSDAKRAREVASARKDAESLKTYDVLLKELGVTATDESR